MIPCQPKLPRWLLLRTDSPTPEAQEDEKEHDDADNADGTVGHFNRHATLSGREIDKVVRDPFRDALGGRCVHHSPPFSGLKCSVPPSLPALCRSP